MVAVAADLASAAAFASGALILLGGPGLHFSIAGFSVRANNPWRWLAVSLAVAATHFAIAWRQRDDPRAEAASAILARLLTSAALMTMAFRAASALVLSCGGLDSAGYVGAADLLARGRLIDAVPVAKLLPFEGATAAAAPLGWVPATEPWHIAPRFPLGLPVVMTIFHWLAGPMGPFFVAPVLGAVSVALAYLIVRRNAPPATAVVAAALVACSPTFVLMAIQPMSDVPATFWLLVAAAAAWAPRPRPLLWALAGGMAMFTRPLLLLPALVIAFTAGWPHRRAAFAGVAALTMLAAAFLAVQWYLYGSPVNSGYGGAGVLFTPSVVPRNVFRHGAWLLRTHTPLVLIAFAGSAYRDRSLAIRAALVFAAVAVPYMFYVNDIDDWEMTRFLLPGWAFVLMACAPGVMWLTRAKTARSALVSACLVAMVTVASLRFLTKEHVFDLRVQEMKYPMLASWIGANTPRDAIVIASLHSGSLRHYTGRAILRLEHIPSPAFTRTIQALEASGSPLYAVVEQGEELSVLMDDVGAADSVVQAQPLTSIRGTYVLRVTAAR